MEGAGTGAEIRNKGGARAENKYIIIVEIYIRLEVIYEGNFSE